MGRVSAESTAALSRRDFPATRQGIFCGDGNATIRDQRVENTQRPFAYNGDESFHEHFAKSEEYTSTRSQPFVALSQHESEAAKLALVRKQNSSQMNEETWVCSASIGKRF